MNVSRTYGRPVLGPEGIVHPSTVSVPQDMPAMDILHIQRDGRMVAISVSQLDTATLATSRARIALDAAGGRHALTLLTKIVEDLERAAR